MLLSSRLSSISNAIRGFLKLCCCSSSYGLSFSLSAPAAPAGVRVNRLVVGAVILASRLNIALAESGLTMLSFLPALRAPETADRHIDLAAFKANSRRVITQIKSAEPQVNLSNALTGFVPPAAIVKHYDGEIIPGLHFVYCNEMMPPSRLLPDGTDDLHCPSPRRRRGEFMFRVWAGGDVSFARPRGRQRKGATAIGGTPTLHLGEQVVDAKMVDGGEKVFVKVRRTLVESASSVIDNNDKEIIRAAALDLKAAENIGNDKADSFFQWLVMPDAALLFRFSALTLNAHAIHLDREYTRQAYGLPDLVVHGPLTVCLMMQVLDHFLQRRYETAPPRGGLLGSRRQPVIDSLLYTNIAPLFVDQTMKICVKPPPPSSSSVALPPGAEAEGKESKDAAGGEQQVWPVWISKKVNGVWRVAVRANAKVFVPT
ncbi:hypothetical protein DV735_g2451, partial [Chaetothyriales sp. CBS 134920]